MSAQDIPGEVREEGDRCHVYVVDIEGGKEFVLQLDEKDGWEELAQKAAEEKKAIAAELETRFDEFYPELGEEERTTKPRFAI